MGRSSLVHNVNLSSLILELSIKGVVLILHNRMALWSIPLNADISDISPSSSPPLPDDLPSTSTLIHSPSPIRRSQRPDQKPAWLSDLVCTLDTSSSYPVISCFSPGYLGFVASLSLLQEPQCYKETSTSPQWVNDMNQEMQVLEHNGTWEVVPLPDGKQTVGGKWVFKVKLKDDGSLDRYKARLVAKGYTQIEGVDYREWFTPVAKAVTIRMFLVVGTAKQWHVHQININNAFHHGHLD
ncbi:UNVERIFIED_CONTAM: Retrovirus-related Pol polyprotein from transposon RE1 [Sesamum latifolium]|uniref:Retrovirus-related Pol polyprotein from transposon RE1 n=1 Tax=Sesamum latifolium TaxID=2727402 RepID=A0AAW2XI19_9LAMI